METTLYKLDDRNTYLNFEDKNNLGKWFTYSTDWPKAGAQHLIWFDYGIYASIEHFNTNESNKQPKDRCLNNRMYNKWIVEVVKRRKDQPHLQVVPFEESLCNSMEDALNVATKYINSNIEDAREAQIEHMRTFKINKLT